MTDEEPKPFVSASRAELMRGRAAEPGARGSTLAVLGWAALGVLSCLAVAPFEPNLLEEGVLLHIAQRLAHGERLYRDVLTFTGPLPFQLLAVLFRIFGEEIWVGRVALAVLHGAASGGVWLCGDGNRGGGAAGH